MSEDDGYATAHKRCHVCGSRVDNTYEELQIHKAGLYLRSGCASLYMEAEKLVKNRVFELVCQSSLLQKTTVSKVAGAEEVSLHMKSEAAMAAEVFEDVKHHYEDPKRFYHTLMHVADLLRQSIETQRTGKPIKLENPEIVDWAILYHDIIYDVNSNMNEENSAVYFHKWAAKWSQDSNEYPLWMPESNVSKICHYIIETKKHDVALSSDTDLQFFIDVDMSILGREKCEEYLQYCDKIRLEYGHLSNNDWRYGRTKFLRSTLDEEKIIFATPEIRDQLESNAKRNIQLELENLESI